MNRYLWKSMAVLAMVFVFSDGCSAPVQEAVRTWQGGESAGTKEEPQETQKPEKQTAESGTSEEEAASLPAALTEATQIYVYVCGAVRKAGVYALPGGSRVADAISLAGGLTDDADPLQVNQAKILTDGEQVTVLTKEEAKAGGVSAGTGNAVSPGVQTAGNGPVNINTADKAALMTLSGIGEIKAEAILEYRQTNGAFRNISEIMKVAGIGEKLYARIKDKITVS